MATAITSAIGNAFSGKTASVDIPTPRDGAFPHGRDSFAAVAARSPTTTKGQHGMLPSPPNSISPHLPPHHQPSKHQLHVPASPHSAPRHIDSDIDLQDEVDHANTQDQPQHTPLSAQALDSLSDLDIAGAITPGMLAKHHLPEILLAHGPLAIRHVMGHLTTTVPGFSRITSAKARRLVVAALEGRGNGGEGGGIDGHVQFEKVGWGRWDARIKGQPPRDRQPHHVSPPASVPPSDSRGGLKIPGQESRHSAPDQLGTSLAAESAVFSHSELDMADQEDVTMFEHEADKMSLDGNDDDYASSESPEPILDESLGEGDATDEEDWQSIGAAALRARSLPSSGRIVSGGGRLYQPIAEYSINSRHLSRAGGTPAFATSVPPVPVGDLSGLSLPAEAGVDDSQERAAVEALLSLGSM